jgi:hypothetical protein
MFTEGKEGNQDWPQIFVGLVNFYWSWLKWAKRQLCPTNFCQGGTAVPPIFYFLRGNF